MAEGSAAENSLHLMAAVKAKSPAKSKGSATKAPKKAPVKSAGKAKPQAAKKVVAKGKPKPVVKKTAPAKKAAPVKAVKKAAPKKVAPVKVVKKGPVKAAPAKVAPKPVAKKPVVPVKKIPLNPVVVPAKKVVEKPVSKPTAVPVEKAQPAAKAAIKPNEKSHPSKVAAPVKAAPATNAVAPKKTPESKAAPATKAVAPKAVAESKNAPAPKSDAGKKTPVKPAVEKADDKLDPLHVKAAKAIKEMEETMDLSRMRPRIQAGTKPAPKAMPRVQAPPLKLVEPTNTSKVKFQLEFEFRASPKILYNYLSDSSGLAGWFADEVKSNKEGIYTFVWEGSESYAKLVGAKELHLVRFQWSDETDGTYFQFEIKEDDITSDVALIITDFANPGERDSNIRLWESQVQKLRMLLGSF